MKLKHPERSIRGQFPMTGLAIAAILILGLLGGMSHHHESKSGSAACSYCHTGTQMPVLNLAAALVGLFFAAAGPVTPFGPFQLPRIVHFSPLIPRGPPTTTH